MNNVVEMQQGLAKLDREREEERALEKSLKPYNLNGLPYDPLRIINEINFFTNQYVGAGFEIASRLILLNERESATTLSHLMKTHLEGFHLRTVQRFNRFARFAAHWPKFRSVFCQPKMVHKGLTLLMNLTDPEIEAELDELEKTGQIVGMDEIEVQGKSVRELQKEVKKLRALRDKKIKDLEAKNERLTSQIEGLAAAGLAPGLEKAQKLLAAGEKQMNEAIRSFAGADFGLLGTDAGSVALCRHSIDKLRRVADELEKQMFPRAVR